MLQAASRLQNATHPQMLHLRSLNPYVASTLEASVRAAARGRGGVAAGFAFHGGFSAARQPSPGVSTATAVAAIGQAIGAAAAEGAAGISAFAFQGTNAHVLLGAAAAFGPTSADSTATAAADTEAQAGHVATQPPAWQRRRFWYAPAPSRLLLAARIAGVGMTAVAVFSMQLDVPSLAYLLDHQVRHSAALFIELLHHHTNTSCTCADTNYTRSI